MDEETIRKLSDAVHEAASALNRAMAYAVQGGLRIDIESETSQMAVNHHPIPILRVHIYQER
ncbi:hypothetical protein [Methylobacterium oxalidis]|uniref:Hydantoinase B/oxoprolinase domain-containing protein n=1 Tax=Methylobacterium oxalidis TaxID=944322 RepID=A0A512J5T8_9HYPH|nr:hypothetical protein [Methylobacterium oxalidis]GEP05344.1 hypothetical protein MOX02_33820 [Methylobacterium oxalidis]GJE31355.1 hypothetical protein LDDCCGHA_1532 [Methylobacterium oxalidis]GLS63517.1 hypothetical protein GCM10007888_18980 [Methylobacterium oxalidis]